MDASSSFGADLGVASLTMEFYTLLPTGGDADQAMPISSSSPSRDCQFLDLQSGSFFALHFDDDGSADRQLFDEESSVDSQDEAGVAADGVSICDDGHDEVSEKKKSECIEGGDKAQQQQLTDQFHPGCGATT